MNKVERNVFWFCTYVAAAVVLASIGTYLHLSHDTFQIKPDTHCVVPITSSVLFLLAGGYHFAKAIK